MKNIGVVFDMDGVISDTQKYHAQVEVDILGEYGITTITPDSDVPITIDRISQNFAGVQPKEWMASLFQSHGKQEKFDIHAIEAKKPKNLLQLYANGVDIQYIPGAKALIHNLANEGIKIFVVTASTRECMMSVLSALHVAEQFTELYSIYDIDPETKKPYISKAEPAIYETIKEKFDVEDFVMIEDGSAGMNGAIKAGGLAIAVLGTNAADKFPQAVSHHTDLTTVDVPLILDILNANEHHK